MGGAWVIAPLRRTPLKPPALPGDGYCIDLLILFVEEGLESKAMTIGSGIYISFATLIESVWGSCADPNAARGPQCDIFIAIEESPLKLLEVQYSNVGFLRISDMLCIKLSLRDKPL